MAEQLLASLLLIDYQRQNPNKMAENACLASASGKFREELRLVLTEHKHTHKKWRPCVLFCAYVTLMLVYFFALANEVYVCLYLPLCSCSVRTSLKTSHIPKAKDYKLQQTIRTMYNAVFDTCSSRTWYFRLFYALCPWHTPDSRSALAPAEWHNPRCQHPSDSSYRNRHLCMAFLGNDYIFMRKKNSTVFPLFSSSFESGGRK